MKKRAIIGCLAFIIVGYKFFAPVPPLCQKISFSREIYDEQHQLLRITLSKDEKYRVFTPLSQISPQIVEATLLEEDQYFFFHPGINPVALVKAAWQTYVNGSRPMGASTITMQLARILYGIQSKHPKGKLLQIFKALQLELLYSKQQILEAYLNLAPYGGNIEGIGAASLIYFGKLPVELNLSEALGLSVIPQNPLKRQPRKDNENHWHKAKNQLFARWITHHPEDQFQQLFMDLPLQLRKKNLPFLAPHFVDRILQSSDSLKVVSTLNLKLQTLIEKITQQYLEKYHEYGVRNAAVLLADIRNCEIKAVIGSGNYFDSSIQGQINGTRARRSPGSTIKPFVYALAMDQGLIHPYTVLKDVPSSFSDYQPENFDKTYLGPLKAKDALVLSRNIPAISLAEQLKNPTLYHFLKHSCMPYLKAENFYGLSLVLGTAEMTMEELVSLYVMLANQGLWRPLSTQKDSSPVSTKRLLSPEASFLTLDMLQELPRFIPISSDNFIPVYWKTGTSSRYRDGLAVGVFGPYVLAVWIGDFKNQNQFSFVGASEAAPLFFELVDAISKQAGPLTNMVEITPQMNLTKVEVCEASGLLPNPHCPNLVSTWFIPGKSPIKKDTLHREMANHSVKAVYNCWSSDILKIFSQAGLSPIIPPLLVQQDHLIKDVEGAAPQIISPRQDFVYTINLSKSSSEILFSAVVDADVSTLYWFVDQNFVGQTQRDEPLVWQAKTGSFLIQVVDDHGRGSERKLEVEVVK